MKVKATSKVSKTFKGTVKEWLNDEQWARVKSSNVYAIAYAKHIHVLLVRFKSSAVYKYEGISPITARRFFEAASMGKFVWQVLRARGYSYRRLW